MRMVATILPTYLPGVRWQAGRRYMAMLLRGRWQPGCGVRGGAVDAPPLAV